MAVKKAMLKVGTKVKVYFDAGWFNDKFYQKGWRSGVIVAHSTVGEAHQPGGYPTYDVELRDGNVIRFCSPSAVKRA